MQSQVGLSEGGNRKNRLHLESRTPSWAGPWTLSYMPSIYGNDIPTGKPGPRKEEPQGSPSLKEYPNFLCNRIESYILLRFLGCDHRPIDNCPLLTIWRRQWQPTPVLRLKAYESRVNFDHIFLFPLFRLVSGNLGRWVCALTLTQGI